LPLESRTRITLILPIPDSLGQFFLLDEVITNLTELCGGVTTSPIFPEPHHDSAFHGWWHDTRHGGVVNDANVLLMADAPLLGSNLALQSYLDTLKLRCQEDFRQDIVWITIHAVDRIAGHDGDAE
jgi:hypothetical protein